MALINNPLSVTHPELCKEWDYDKNDITPDQIRDKSKINVWWVCKSEKNCGCHEWQTLIYNRTIRNRGCLFCTNQRACKHTSLLGKYPQLCKEWDYEKNDINPDKLLPKSNKSVWWICQINPCGCHHWQTTICSRTNLESGCPYCSGRSACKHTSLLSKFPDLCNEWDYEKNTINPNEVTPFSGKIIWWKCLVAACDCHRWKTTINDRTKNNPTGCPFCVNSKICPHNSLLAKFPKLCEEWDYDKNLISPNEVAPGSSKIVWWKCSKSQCKCHSWSAVIHSRTNKKLQCGCPFCESKQICMHNSLLSKYPKLCKEWYYTKNDILPFECSPYANIKVWWKCSNNESHIWNAVIRNRTALNRNCPYCNFSKGEIAINQLLKSKNIKYIHQKRFVDCIDTNPLSFDFYLDGYNIIIEFDGIQHFEPIEHFGGTHEFLDRQKKDNIKNKYCKENHISLLRISYQEIDQIEILFNNFLLDVANNDTFIVNFSNKLLYKNMKNELEKIE